ncbi:MAG: cob(I)yrinic acid a,c-diamide adenosyltransferase [Lentisphaeraceae bacterium]|nr:cob(I)yrinic acid a,c-diamide adenosyltransferase [Lentisphaeraceae bacterium]
MVLISKVYTKTGDKGMTRLASGDEVSKDDLRIDTYGTVDELNSLCGMVRTLSEENIKLKKLAEELKVVQNRLFDLGSDLSTPIEGRWENMRLINEADITEVEKWLDKANEDLQPLKSFTLPGGSQVNAYLHLCRTVCRRAERLCVTLTREQGINPCTLKYLNRLSDYFFVWSRAVAVILDHPEYLWER